MFVWHRKSILECEINTFHIGVWTVLYRMNSHCNVNNLELSIKGTSLCKYYLKSPKRAEEAKYKTPVQLQLVTDF